MSSTSLSAENLPGWEESDFEGEIKKLETEAEQRLDAKVAEMKSKIEATGSN
jgi:hypothetical protein